MHGLLLDAVGPLQVSSGEWKSFLKDGGDLAKPFKPFNPSDFDNYRQPQNLGRRP